MNLKQKIKRYLRKTKSYELYSLFKMAASYKKKLEETEIQLEYLKEHADIFTLKPAKGELRSRQIRLVNFAQEFFERIESLDIKPFMVAGTLIGSIRHKGFIPWDDDLDFGLTRKDYFKLIDFCEKEFVVTRYQESWSKYTEVMHLDRINALCKKYPNNYILDVWVDQIQIFRGTSVVNRLSIDFWPFDFFVDSYTFKEHLDYIGYIRNKQREIDTVDKIVDFTFGEIKKSSTIIDFGTNMYFGIDSVPQHNKKNESWINSRDVFPLKKMEFEGSYFWAPRNHDNYIKFEYKEYLKFPTDVGIAKHNYYEKYINERLINVEFFLVDSFEIFHFYPLYKAFIERGYNAKFIAEPCDTDASYTWFDYEEAVKILDNLGVFYSKKCNPNAHIAFTTQDAYNLSKYKNKKIFMSYGVGFNLKSFGYTDRVTKGFDLCLVNGQFMFDVFSKTKEREKLVIMGSPKYIEFFNYPPTREQVMEELGIKTDKKILLYYPTWDEDSSIQSFAESIKVLRSEYFIVAKAHHCTFRLDEKKADLDMLKEISDIVLPGNYSFGKSAVLGDIAICDAKSGASSEVCYLNENLNVVLLSVREDYEKYFAPAVHSIGPLINRPENLYNTVSDIELLESFKVRREGVINSCYGERGENYLLNIIKKIEDICFI